jgi:hypothetical protein
MENVMGKLKEKITASLGDQPEARFDTLKIINKTASELSEEAHFTDYLKDKKNIKEIYLLIKNKKMSNNQIKNKIKEYLNDPEDLNKFLKSILDSNKTKKKEENKEAMGASSAGAYSAPLFSTTKGDIVKGVKTVREQSEPTEEGEIVKSETKEATSSSSSGQYSQPSIWAKSMSKKNWKGASTKYMPGAKRVQVKKKCKKFPYCNQGDISALKIFENESVKNAVDSVSSKYGVDKEYIFGILSKQIGKTIK